MGVKTCIADQATLEINPEWLGFDMFESMKMSIMSDLPEPGDTLSQEWRNSFTVGIASDWHLSPYVALRAGYRFYANPMPDEISHGAYPNADQHVAAVSMNLTRGRHSLSLVYGINLLDPASSAGISNARYGSNIPELNHLVTFSYAFSF